MTRALTVRLPGHTDDSPTQIRIAPLRGRDEKWLLGLPSETPRERVVTRILSRRSGFGTRAVRDLPVGERNYLVLKLGQVTFGSRVEISLSCPRPHCGAPMHIDFDVDDLPVTRLRRRTDYPLSGAGGAHRSIRFRLPTGRDLEDAAIVGADDPETALLARCLVAGAPEAVDNPTVRAAVETEMERVMPGVPQELETLCVDCGHEFDTEFDPVEWLLSRIRRGRAGLDRDIHLLSLHYHWPLDSILAMSGPRRREYVSLLERQIGFATS
ncbi:MAG: hypothetical protein SYR96_24890 [Actinomycetota bacterium]|nr:hypothetical protein [Actinomycetota bacterium]